MATGPATCGGRALSAPLWGSGAATGQGDARALTAAPGGRTLGSSLGGLVGANDYGEDADREGLELPMELDGVYDYYSD